MKRNTYPIVAASLFYAAAADAQSIEALKQLSVDELLDVQVTSVSKHAESLSDAPASIFVITADDIRRSGATTLAEALRIAPNLDVARIDSVQYAISARGFNNAVGNKLLVMVDGRTIYTPLFSGVFWDQQDVLLQDVERIEVISGPGATLWGANAVNGVINVITRPAQDTTDALLLGTVGETEDGGAFRLGARRADAAFRVYGKYSKFDNTSREDGVATPDGWSRGQAGFRADWAPGADRITLQGDVYDGHSQSRGVVLGIDLGEVSVSGFNVLGRWSRQIDEASDLQLQMYVDHSERHDALFYGPTADIVDIDFQHSISGRRHSVLWGGGYRYGQDDIEPGYVTVFVPDSRAMHWGNLFIQDEVHLTPALQATLGLKLESNDYTGVEYLPNVRLAWQLPDNSLLWGSLSRAVRAPARYDRDVRFPGFPPYALVGGPHFESEVANVAELGYRAQPLDALGVSVTSFLHRWDRLRSGSALPVEIENRIEGDVYGVEAWLNYRPFEFWSLSAGGTWLREDLRLEAGSMDPVGVDNPTLRNDPDYYWTLHSAFDVTRTTKLDLWLYSVDDLPQPQVPSYTELEIRVAWAPVERIELSIVGRNLLHDSHPEYGDALSRSVIERTVYGQVRWEF